MYYQHVSMSDIKIIKFSLVEGLKTNEIIEFTLNKFDFKMCLPNTRNIDNLTIHGLKFRHL